MKRVVFMLFVSLLLVTIVLIGCQGNKSIVKVDDAIVGKFEVFKGRPVTVIAVALENVSKDQNVKLDINGFMLTTNNKKDLILKPGYFSEDEMARGDLYSGWTSYKTNVAISAGGRKVIFLGEGLNTQVIHNKIEWGILPGIIKDIERVAYTDNNGLSFSFKPRLATQEEFEAFMKRYD